MNYVDCILNWNGKDIEQFEIELLNGKRWFETRSICFVICGFTEKGKPPREANIIKKELEGRFEVHCSSDYIKMGKYMQNEICNAILRSHLVVIIYNKLRMNIGFEHGYVYGIKHSNIILLAHKKTLKEIEGNFSDVKSDYFLPYSRPEEIKRKFQIDRRLKKVLSNAVKRRHGKANEYFKLGVKASDNPSDYGQAKGWFHKAINEDPLFIDPYEYLSYLYLATRNYEETEKVSKSALRIDPNSFIILNNLAVVLAWHRNKKTKALELLKKAKKAHPDNELTYFNLGKLYTVMGRDADARKCFEMVIPRYSQQVKSNTKIQDAEKANLCECLGICYCLLNNTREAKYYFKKGIEHARRCIQVYSEEKETEIPCKDFRRECRDKIKDLSNT